MEKQLKMEANHGEVGITGNLVSYNQVVPTRQGWECPKCHKVFAPEVKECTTCGKAFSNYPYTTWQTGIGTSASEDVKINNRQLLTE